MRPPRRRTYSIGGAVAVEEMQVLETHPRAGGGKPRQGHLQGKVVLGRATVQDTAVTARRHLDTSVVTAAAPQFYLQDVMSAYRSGECGGQYFPVFLSMHWWCQPSYWQDAMERQGHRGGGRAIARHSRKCLVQTASGMAAGAAVADTDAKVCRSERRAGILHVVTAASPPRRRWEWWPAPVPPDAGDG